MFNEKVFFVHDIFILQYLNKKNSSLLVEIWYFQRGATCRIFAQLKCCTAMAHSLQFLIFSVNCIQFMECIMEQCYHWCMHSCLAKTAERARSFWHACTSSWPKWTLSSLLTARGLPLDPTTHPKYVTVSVAVSFILASVCGRSCKFAVVAALQQWCRVEIVGEINTGFASTPTYEVENAFWHLSQTAPLGMAPTIPAFLQYMETHWINDATATFRIPVWNLFATMNMFTVSCLLTFIKFNLIFFKLFKLLYLCLPQTIFR